MYRFVPHDVARPWGGESWVLADLSMHQSTTHEGVSLHELWSSGALGGSGKGPFPLLLKWLDTREALSIQVHPNPSVANMLGSSSKSEAWYVLHAEPGAEILCGFREGVDQDEAMDAYGSPRVVHLLDRIHPKPGMLITVPAGLVHAVGKGLLLLEVQEPSDTTYRIYAWDRAGVALHVHEAQQATQWDAKPVIHTSEAQGPSFLMRTLHGGDILAAEKLRVVVCVGRNTMLEGHGQRFTLNHGDVRVFGTADHDLVCVHGDAVWITEPWT